MRSMCSHEPGSPYTPFAIKAEAVAEYAISQVHRGDVGKHPSIRDVPSVEVIVIRVDVISQRIGEEPDDDCHQLRSSKR